ncbi:MAG TPA: OmpA family protein [Propionibacteriaceae bacterium]
MSPSPERRLSAVVATATLAILACLQPMSASADELPVRTIVAPVLDIQFATADLKREARTETRSGTVKVTLDSTVLFAKDSAKITSRADNRIATIAADLKSRGPGKVTITGYTDDLGTRAYGRQLSKKRANAVAGKLRSGLPAADFPFTVVGKGEDDPAVPNKSEANRKINRRVVILYQHR